jgi:hypothetical protein
MKIKTYYKRGTNKDTNYTRHQITISNAPVFMLRPSIPNCICCVCFKDRKLTNVKNHRSRLLKSVLSLWQVVFEKNIFIKIPPHLVVSEHIKGMFGKICIQLFLILNRTNSDSLADKYKKDTYIVVIK